MYCGTPSTVGCMKGKNESTWAAQQAERTLPVPLAVERDVLQGSVC